MKRVINFWEVVGVMIGAFLGVLIVVHFSDWYTVKHAAFSLFLGLLVFVTVYFGLGKKIEETE